MQAARAKARVACAPFGSMQNQGILTAGVLAAALMVSPLSAYAQGRPLRVTGTRGISFGSVIPGLPLHVLKSDPARGGAFELRGEKFSVLQLVFALPATMAGPAGATMPLTFDAADGGFSAEASITAQATFDPRAPAFGQLSKIGQASVFLGGTVRPASTQRAGAYSAIITLTVSYTGT